MTRSVTIESLDRIRSSTFEYNYRSSAGLSRSSMLFWYDVIRADTLYDQVCSIEIGCGFGLTTFSITIEGDHDLSHDWTRRVYKQPN